MIDDLVLQVVGKESPIIQGLAVSESTVLPAAAMQLHRVISDAETTFFDLGSSSSSTPLPITTTCSMGILLPTAAACSTPVSSVPFTRKRKILENDTSFSSKRDALLLENLRLRNKKLKLEIKFLQNQLNLTSYSSGSESA